MNVKCPKSKRHKRFVTTAHEVHDWVLDENGEFVKDLGCSEMSADPDINNIWTCHVCGAQAIVTEE
jgi:TPP-dependent indolepyruvate ferredoxin oxidoreductase alpha subunit